MTPLQKRLFELRDPDYALFQAKLTPTLDRDRFIGVRLPVLRAFAKDFARDAECAAFLESLPHDYYDENLLHAILISKTKDYGECLRRVEAFLPHIDNWAVCDTLRPPVFVKHREELLPVIRHWSKSRHTYTCRFAIDMLMTYYLDEAFIPALMEIPCAVRSSEYYVNMMIAWYFATALAKQWEAALPVIENHRLDDWTHKKAIRKAIESYRITDEQKAYLRTLK